MTEDITVTKPAASFSPDGELIITNGELKNAI